MISGFCLEIRINSSFGDLYYVGLNEIEIWNEQGENILKQRKNQFKMIAFPPGVFIDPEMGKDKRQVKNLINGNRLSNKFEDIWLTFLIKNQINVFKSSTHKTSIVIQFENPV